MDDASDTFPGLSYFLTLAAIGLLCAYFAVAEAKIGKTRDANNGFAVSIAMLLLAMQCLAASALEIWLENQGIFGAIGYGVLSIAAVFLAPLDLFLGFWLWGTFGGNRFVDWLSNRNES